MIDGVETPLTEPFSFSDKTLSVFSTDQSIGDSYSIRLKGTAVGGESVSSSFNYFVFNAGDCIND